MSDPLHELQSIQAMLASGHRCVRLEAHSLLLFGALGAGLSIGTDWAITPERFPDTGERALVVLAWLAVWLIGVSLIDHWLTRRSRQARAQTVPFAQAQLTRAWWLLLGVGALGSFAMFFHGGGQMVYALWIVLLGLGIYLFGLFSRPLVEWIGVAAILLGVVSMAADLPLGATRWLNACCFAIGLPLAGWLAAHVGERAWLPRVAAVSLWLVAVVVPALAAVSAFPIGTPAGPVRAAGAADLSTGERILRLERGASVPMRLSLDGPILSAQPTTGASLRLSVPLELALRDGQPDGRYRLDGGRWSTVRSSGPRLMVDTIQVQLVDGRPEIRVHALVDDPTGGAR